MLSNYSSDIGGQTADVAPAAGFAAAETPAGYAELRISVLSASDDIEQKTEKGLQLRRGHRPDVEEVRAV